MGLLSVLKLSEITIERERYTVEGLPVFLLFIGRSVVTFSGT
jgi:hypothetical protein